MADTESYGETDESEDTLTEEAAQKGLEKALPTWREQYVQSVHTPTHLETKCSQFITDLTNSSLTIKDVQDGIGTSYTSVQIDSGALTLDWDELFEKKATRQLALTACLVYASIFIPAMVVKYYRIFSARNILKLVSAQVIRVEWTASINGRRKTTRLNVPRGEIQYFEMKAQQYRKGTQDWWMQLVKPMSVTYENDYGTEIKYHAKRGKFYTDGKTILSPITIEKTALLMTEMSISFYFYAKTVLSQNLKLWRCLQDRRKGLNLYAANNTKKGSRTTYTSQEYWYFRNR
ncbi:uncharacterized protein [Maniola hyperantus]|uniref:uncharacterized protein n=1 Tax=Aphantopus hyperantus TaxID=2795564 RepID=UPI003748A5F8